MRKISSLTSMVLVVIALASCQKKTETVSEISSDSLLASNPVEQPAGNLAPQAEYETPQQAPQSTPTQTPRPKATTPKPRHDDRPSAPAQEPGITIAAGTPIQVSVTTQISSENVNSGDSWSGEVKEPVMVGNEVVIPAGSTVIGVIEGSRAAEKGSRAYLLLGVRSISVNGRSYDVSASTDSIVAGSTRARNLGAIAGSAAAGALIGKAVGGSGKGAVIGGLLGGAAATGAVAKSKGYQVVLKEGTTVTFNVDHKVTMRS